jgi:hypothetical protein
LVTRDQVIDGPVCYGGQGDRAEEDQWHAVLPLVSPAQVGPSSSHEPRAQRPSR